MTIQSLAWVLEQPVPGTAKLVLMALGNHADHTNGYVHFDAATIAREATIEVRSLWRYLGALERNGYLAKDEHRAGAEKRNYWLGFDRDVTRPWSWSADEQVEADETSAPPATSDAPTAFRPVEQAKARAAVEAPSAAQGLGVPIIDGSRAAKEWADYLRARGQIPPFVMAIKTADGKDARGFYMPSLFPPADDGIESLEGAA